jgi:hypothetical protein
MRQIVLVGALALTVQADALSEELFRYHTHRVDVAHRHGETEGARKERMRWIGDGIVAACETVPLERKLGWRPLDCVALAAIMAEWESGLMIQVQSGEKRGPAGEIGLWQLHRFVSAVPNASYRVSPQDLKDMVGLSPVATVLQALGGVKTIGWHVHRCQLHRSDVWTVARIFAEYHHPSVKCNAVVDTMSMQRSASYRNLLHRLETH